MESILGKPVRRLEDARLLSGKACFVDDIHVPDVTEMAVFRSPHAHARLQSLDLSAARRAPGVIAVLGAADLGDDLPTLPIRLAPRPGFSSFLQHPLALDGVRYVGEPVAIIVAESRYQAEDALPLIRAEWHILPAIVEMGDDGQNRNLLFEDTGSNVAGTWHVGRGDVEHAFRQAAYRRTQMFRVQRQSPFPLETRGLIAEYDSDGPALKLTGATKVNYFNRRWLSQAFGIPETAVELVEVDVGGGFGSRGELYPEDYLVAAASRHVCRPVKWIEDRREHLIAANHAREVECRLEIAASSEGDILGLRAVLRGDLGAYVRTNGGVSISRTAQFLPGPYHVPAYACDVEAVMTNKTPAGTYRGPGRFEANFFRERMIDLMAHDLGIDPADIRFRNLLKPDDLPYSVGALVPGEKPASYEKGDFPAALQVVLQKVNYESWRERQGRGAEDGRRHGLGLACFVESSAGGPPEVARATVLPDGRVELRVGASSMGQGLKTTMAQICADSLGIAMETVSVLHGTTSLLEDGGGTFHSRNAVMAGNAARLAAEGLRERCLDQAAFRWNTERDTLFFDTGVVRDEAGGRTLSLAELAEFAHEALTFEASFDNRGRTAFSYGAHAAHVAVDVETGQVRLLNYVVCEDIGKILNPMIAVGQAVGGAAQGIGGALLDRFLFDQDGQPLATNLSEYLLPTSLDTGNIEAIITGQYPSAANPMGVKGVGEGGIVAAGGAIGNAIAQALGEDCPDLCRTPFDPVLLRSLIDSAEPGES